MRSGNHPFISLVTGPAILKAKAFASGVTSVADVIVPEVFSPYVQNTSMELSALIRSGAIVSSPVLSNLLAGGGLTFNEPFFKDLDNEEENTPVDDYTQLSAPKKITTSDEKQVRLNRNQSWSSTDLASQLAGADPMMAIANRVANYWSLRIQAAFVATITGIFADNDAVPTGTDTHDQYDMTQDVSDEGGGSYAAGSTDFSAEAFLDACQTMGDAMGNLTLVMVHSVVYTRMLKNNLIDFISDSVNGNAISVPTFLGRRVVVDDGITNAAGVFHTWLFGAGAVQMGNYPPPVPTETERKPDAGVGGGQDILYSRQQWIMHPVGHAYIGNAPKGGPKNTSGTAPLNAAASWSRVFPERKQIRIARLITREF